MKVSEMAQAGRNAKRPVNNFADYVHRYLPRDAARLLDGYDPNSPTAPFPYGELDHEDLPRGAFGILKGLSIGDLTKSLKRT